MKMAIKATGITVVAFGIIIEIIGIFYANDALQHNAYGWAGGILAVLGIIAINRGTKPPITRTNLARALRR